MAVTEWVAINQDRVLGAYVVDGLLDRWFQQTHWPVAETPLSQWLMDQVGYEKPEPEFVSLFRPQQGQGWPIWAANPHLADVRIAELEGLLTANGVTF